MVISEFFKEKVIKNFSEHTLSKIPLVEKEIKEGSKKIFKTVENNVDLIYTSDAFKFGGFFMLSLVFVMLFSISAAQFNIIERTDLNFFYLLMISILPNLYVGYINLNSFKARKRIRKIFNKENINNAIKNTIKEILLTESNNLSYQDKNLLDETKMILLSLKKDPDCIYNEIIKDKLNNEKKLVQEYIKLCDSKNKNTNVKNVSAISYEEQRKIYLEKIESEGFNPLLEIDSLLNIKNK